MADTVRRLEKATSPDVSAVRHLAERLLDNLCRVIRGKSEPLHLATVALLGGGHLLMEDVPGVGKTLLSKTLARSIGGTFARIQGTPDLLPAELTGVSVFVSGSETWEFHRGPLFANVVMVDEINRVTPRTQSALLEAMEENQVTVDGRSHPLPDPFFLVATQNPFEQLGTFPLVEGQIDRFDVVIHLGYPARGAEREVLLGTGGAEHLDEVASVTSPSELQAIRTTVRRVHCEPSIADYVIDIVTATREHPGVVRGASPRASLGLVRAAQAHAAIEGRDFVVPDDVKAVAAPALAHRVMLPGGPQIQAGAALVEEVVSSLPVPR